ncbi:ABC transporter substrate-binding protein [Micromonospora globbae]|jgi:polar amino acid transport system substrate-binding protein|uniref:ABC transporter substrate-binding protein n=1 Tax=Micromonospora globbae TaxID=1894969 RepID=A0A420F6F7_9ACTN|nr:ABC transporter substrate-binding protein [Micromonospora globbae]RKF28512.1 ABC transporter substrate-binding protein [Micromonospora globbae]WTF84642.1 ABC transporter substrate-binding protein [Micromonospora globbae]
MFNITGRRRAVLGAAGAAALLLSLAACGEEEGGEATGTGPTVSASADTSLADKVPDAIKADGKIVVGTDSTYAPAEFLDEDGKTVVGFDVELFTAVAQKLGLQAEFVSAPFGDIIAGVNSGKYEVGVSSFTINDERKTQANMISYFQVGTQWVTKAGNPAGVTIDNACGKKIAVQKDTVQVEDIEKRSKACTDAGKPAITVEQFPGQDAATAAVVSGKDDAMLADYPVGVYAVTQSNGALELLDKQYEAAPYGYVVAKDQTAFAEAVRDATKALIADGSYKTVLDKWKVGDGAITDPAINP